MTSIRDSVTNIKHSTTRLRTSCVRVGASTMKFGACAIAQHRSPVSPQPTLTAYEDTA